MKALVLEGENQFPVLREVQISRENGKHQLVQIKAAALNHRDLWMTKGLYPALNFPMILGSDGAGLCKGREVVIQPGINWGNNPRAQSKNYEILGSPSNGTFAEMVLVLEDQIFNKPPHLSFEQAAALPLAGLTAFRMLFTKCQVKAGEKILITGIGGGVALTCCQFALAAGLEVFVTSGSEEKIGKARALGVVDGIDYRQSDWSSQLQSTSGGFDVIIDSAGGESFAELVKLCNPGGRIGIYGGSKGKIPNLSPQLIFWRQISIYGSTMGTSTEFGEMLEFITKNKIVPVVDSVFSLGDGREAFKRMDEGKQFGKIVLKVG